MNYHFIILLVDETFTYFTTNESLTRLRLMQN